MSRTRRWLGNPTARALARKASALEEARFFEAVVTATKGLSSCKACDSLSSSQSANAALAKALMALNRESEPVRIRDHMQSLGMDESEAGCI